MEVRTVRRLALLLAGGALWILFAAAPVFADGGPHQMAVNNGTSGLAGDCAACHRAHTAQAADLLKAQMPGLCLTCHDGTGATANVVDGYQFTPDGAGNPTSTILGALRGGGFEYALIDTGAASRLSYSSRGGIVLTFSSSSASGSVTLTWEAFGTFAGGDLTFDASNSAATVQALATPFFGTSTTYSGSGASNMTGLPTANALMTVSKSGTTGAFTFAPQSEFRLLETIPLPDVSNNATGETATVTNGISIGGAGHVGVLAVLDKQATTSTHEGAGTVWGNGPQGQGNPGATGVVLECTGCHNPHGNGQYRILNTLPGEDWSNGAVHASTTLAANVTTGSQTSITVASASGFPMTDFVIEVGAEQMLVTGGQGTTTWTVTRGYNGTVPGSPASGTVVDMVTSDWTAPINAVEVKDGAALTAGQVHNYTVKPGYLTTDVVADPLLGDYWRYKFDTAGVTNFTNFYLTLDPMNTGWNGTSATNAAANSGVAPANTTGLMTAWCITCHTRYNGWAQNGTSSLFAQTPIDDVFMYKHGTTRLGCEQCHVNHGSNAAMTAQFSASYLFPDGTHEDSALLKVNNRGTCNLCHDPTGTVEAGTEVGAVPGAITPGP
jgi:predicted CXXCH cytochrome family protein